MRCAIWHHLHNLKNMKNTHGEVLLLVKLQAKVTLLDGCFSRFLNCANDIKLRKTSQMFGITFLLWFPIRWFPISV